jgi:hypothetical protein
MATLTATIAANVGANTTGSTAGQDITATGATPTTGTGDLYPINLGTGTLIIITTAGTSCTFTVDSILLSSYGTDQDLTITCPATGVVIVCLDVDGYRRFDQGGGNAGFAKLTPSANTNVKVYAVIVN